MLPSPLYNINSAQALRSQCTMSLATDVGKFCKNIIINTLLTYSFKNSTDKALDSVVSADRCDQASVRGHGRVEEAERESIEHLYRQTPPGVCQSRVEQEPDTKRK